MDRDDKILSELSKMNSKIDKVYSVLFFDDETKRYGILSEMEATKVFQKDIMEEVSSIRQCNDKLSKDFKQFGVKMDNAVEKLAEIAIWKEGIQGIPSKTKTFVLESSKIIIAGGVVLGFLAYNWEKIKKFLTSL